MRSKVLARVTAILAGGAAIALIGAATAAAEPFHWYLPDRFKQPPTTAQCLTSIGIACYQPSQFQQAYNLKPLYDRGLNGAGQTIVIVDSFGSPTIANDITTFDQETGVSGINVPGGTYSRGLPSLRIITPAGKPPAYDTNNFDMGGWAFETSLDVEYAHTFAPGANILLVETPVDETLGVQGFPQMIQAENYVIDHHLGDVISQSFGATEQTFPNAQAIYSLRSAYFNALHHHVTVLSASGDGGATDDSALDTQNGATNWYPFRVNSWPSSDPLVTSVGGTQLHLDANGNRTAPDNVWNDTAMFGSPAAGGGGVSTVFSRPDYQDGVRQVVGPARGTPDVAMSAAVNGAALVYLTWTNAAYGITQPGWYLVGGTSEATPEMAGIVSIADQAAHHRLGLLNPTLYAMSDRAGIDDITNGNNSVFGTEELPPVAGQTFSVTGFNAVPGYDLSSGLGTINGAAFVERLAHRGFARDKR